jgi:hypothetical protein
LLSSALSLQAADIRITSFSCAEYTVFNSSSSSSSSAASLDYSMTDQMDIHWDPINPADEPAYDGAAPSETAYADVSTWFTVAMPADAQQQAQIASTILQDTSRLLTIPMSRFFSAPVRAIYTARAEQQVISDSDTLAESEGNEVPLSMPAAANATTAAPRDSAAITPAESIRQVAAQTHTVTVPPALHSSMSSVKQQQRSSTAVPQPTGMPLLRRDTKPQQQQQQQKQQPQAQAPPKQQPQPKQQTAAGNPVATPVPVSASDAANDVAKKSLNAAAHAAVDTANAAVAAVTSLKITKQKPASELYTPMLPPT